MSVNILNSDINEVQDAESIKALDFIEKAKNKVSEIGTEIGRKPKACVVTFGCQMNARDSEKLLKSSWPL